MQNKYIYYLIIINFLGTNVVVFLDEGIHTFEYLTRFIGWVALLLYIMLFLILPLTLFLSFFICKVAYVF